MVRRYLDTHLNPWLWQRLPGGMEAYARGLGLGWRRSHSPTPRPPSAILIAPAGAGSLGDAAMLTAAVQTLTQKAFERFTLVYPAYWGADGDWSGIPGLTADSLGIRFQSEPFGGDLQQAIAASAQDYRAFIALAREATHVFCVGADVLDGFYAPAIPQLLARLCAIAATLGCKTTIIGFSFNQKPLPESIAALQRLPATVRFCCRDAMSQERFQSLVQRPATLVADAAFLLQPTLDGENLGPTLDWIASQRQRGRSILGINLNPITAQHLNLDAAAFAAHYVTLVTQLFDRLGSVSVLFIPHDVRDAVNDVTLAHQVCQGLAMALPERQPDCHVAPETLMAYQAKGLCGEIDLLVTGRMHMAIAALGQGCPPIGITYQGKFEGLYRHFGLQGLTLSPEQAFPAQQLAPLVVETWPQLAMLRQQIRQGLAPILSLAAANFEI